MLYGFRGTGRTNSTRTRCRHPGDHRLHAGHQLSAVTQTQSVQSGKPETVSWGTKSKQNQIVFLCQLWRNENENLRNFEWHLDRWSWWLTKRSKVILIWRAVIQQRSSGFLRQNSDIRQRWIMVGHGWSWDTHGTPMLSCHASLRLTKSTSTTHEWGWAPEILPLGSRMQHWIGKLRIGRFHSGTPQDIQKIDEKSRLTGRNAYELGKICCITTYSWGV